jgi:nucleotide-binding universal stress UspA family protein
MILAKKFGAKITFLHVQESGLFGSKPEMARQIGKHVLARAAKKANGVESDEKLESGDVGKKIGEVAEKEDYDIIVMGGKGHGGIKRFLLGSASNHVLHYTGHPVLIVK